MFECGLKLARIPDVFLWVVAILEFVPKKMTFGLKYLSPTMC